MLRYLALASLIVFAGIALLLALPRPPTSPGRDRYVGGRARAGPGDRSGGPLAGSALSGVAPWALSVVPECFHQTASWSGTPAFARAHLPKGALPVASGTLHEADCTLTVSRHSARLERGDVRLVVPAPARFSTSGKRLVLDQVDGGREEVRIYRLRDGAAPAFSPASAAASP